MDIDVLEFLATAQLDHFREIFEKEHVSTVYLYTKTLAVYLLDTTSTVG